MERNAVTVLDQEWVELILKAKRQKVSTNDLHDLFSGRGQRTIVDGNVIVSFKEKPARPHSY